MPVKYYRMRTNPFHKPVMKVGITRYRISTTNSNRWKGSVRFSTRNYIGESRGKPCGSAWYTCFWIRILRISHDEMKVLAVNCLPDVMGDLTVECYEDGGALPLCDAVQWESNLLRIAIAIKTKTSYSILKILIQNQMKVGKFILKPVGEKTRGIASLKWLLFYLK